MSITANQCEERRQNRAKRLQDQADATEYSLNRVRKFAAAEGIDSELALVLIRENIRRGVRRSLEEHLSAIKSELDNDPSLREALKAAHEAVQGGAA